MGPCLYCGKNAEARVEEGEYPGVDTIYVCEVHWKILKNPKLAMNLMKANIAKSLRGKEAAKILELKFRQFERFANAIKTKNSTNS